MELTLKQYANQANITYEAARASFAVHDGRELVEGVHYRKSGRTRILMQPGIDVMNGIRGQTLIPVMIPGEIDRLHDEIRMLQSKIEELEKEKDSLKSEIASQNLQIADLTAKLDAAKDSLISSLFQIQNLQGRLLDVTAPEPAADPEPGERKQGLFSRLFRRN